MSVESCSLSKAYDCSFCKIPKVLHAIVTFNAKGSDWYLYGTLKTKAHPYEPCDSDKIRHILCDPWDSETIRHIL